MRTDANWLEEQLGGWVAGVPGCAVESGAIWSLEANAGAGALPVRVEVDDDAIAVRIGAWERVFAAGDEDAVREAADLVAAALFGRIRAEVHRVADRWVRYRLELRVGSKWEEIALIKRMHLAVWKRPVVSQLRNDFEPPSSVRLTGGGTLPYAPWVGLLELDDDAGEGGPRPLPVDGEIDLHPFRPKEVAGVVRAYIDACLEQGIYELRVVHGKGIGNLRRTVHALLDEHPAVAGYRLGGSGGGGWGATIVDLHQPKT